MPTVELYPFSRYTVVQLCNLYWETHRPMLEKTAAWVGCMLIACPRTALTWSEGKRWDLRGVVVFSTTNHVITENLGDLNINPLLETLFEKYKMQWWKVKLYSHRNVVKNPHNIPSLTWGQNHSAHSLEYMQSQFTSPTLHI